MSISLRASLDLFLLIAPALAASVACGLISEDPATGSGGTGSGDGEVTASGGATGVVPGSGGSLAIGSEGQACPEVDNEESFDCPDYCVAIEQTKCAVASGYDLIAVDGCFFDNQAVAERITWSTGGFQKSCFYSGDGLFGARATASTDSQDPCNLGSTGDVAWGMVPGDCPDLIFETCAEQPGEGGAPSEPPVALCMEFHSGECFPCCSPFAPLDCDGPGADDLWCVESNGCTCGCQDGERTCAC